MLSITDWLSSQFSKPHGRWGHVVGWVMATQNLQRVETVVAHLPLQPGQTVLEIGCGPGIGLAQTLSRLGPDGTAIGVDHSSIMIDQARRRNVDAVSSGRLLLHHGAFDNLQQPEARVDGIYMINTLHHLGPEDSTVKALLRLLTPGGWLVFGNQPIGSWPEERGFFASLVRAEQALMELAPDCRIERHVLPLRAGNPLHLLVVQDLRPAP